MTWLSMNRSTMSLPNQATEAGKFSGIFKQKLRAIVFWIQLGNASQEAAEVEDHLMELCGRGQAADVKGVHELVNRLTTFAAQMLVNRIDERLIEASPEEADLNSTRQQVLLYVCREKNVLPNSVQNTKTLRKVGPHAVGGGSFSDLWRGSLGRQDVAIKAIRVFMCSGDKKAAHFKQAFFREALLWRSLKHRHVLPFLGINTTLFSLALVSPWMDNGGMRSYFEHEPLADRRELLRKVSEGLKFLHTRDPPVIHGDLKGDNIVVDAAGEPYICDFGISRLALDAEFSTPFTRAATMSGGTLRWTAPEILTSEKVVRPTTQSDVYSFGHICCEAYTGNMPFHDKTDSVVLQFMKDGNTPPEPDDEQLEQQLPENVRQLMKWCWAIKPVDRPTAKQCTRLLRGSDVTPS